MAGDQDNLQQKLQTVKRVGTPAAQCDRRQLRFLHEAEFIAVRATAFKVGRSMSETLIARLIAAGTSRPLVLPLLTWEANLDWLQYVFSSVRRSRRVCRFPLPAGGNVRSLASSTPLLVVEAAAQGMAMFVPKLNFRAAELLVSESQSDGESRL